MTIMYELYNKNSNNMVDASAYDDRAYIARMCTFPKFKRRVLSSLLISACFFLSYNAVPHLAFAQDEAEVSVEEEVISDDDFLSEIEAEIRADEGESQETQPNDAEVNLDDVLNQDALNQDEPQQVEPEPIVDDEDLLPTLSDVSVDVENTDESAADAESESSPGAEIMIDSSIDPETIPSLLFTYWEHSAIIEAKNSRGLARAPTDTEMQSDLDSNQMNEKPRPPEEERYIRLGGIAYQSPDRWTIWLNEKRVTPDALPKEVMDLKVFKDYIEVKWYDDYTNRIYPIRLRPHQRFNVDTRIFLPG